MSSDFFAVITTIQQPTEAVCRLAAAVKRENGTLVVAGDAKGPTSFDVDGAEFLSLDQQRASRFSLSRELPVGHYARKNIGYLTAMANGASVIYETDDDNAPNEAWSLRSETVSAARVRGRGWVNAYRAFTSGRIWPRGFPLDEVSPSMERALELGAPEVLRAPIQQGLADHSPDVDAVWRLTLDQPFEFDGADSIQLSAGAWCPFNSQSTWWWPEAYPLMYLPSHCSFRMTDIWRSFIAQRCLWELGYGVVFHSPDVVQERNPHTLMRDFEQELPGYLRNAEIAEVLRRLPLEPGKSALKSNMRICYEGLVREALIPVAELSLLSAWLDDLVCIESRR